MTNGNATEKEKTGHFTNKIRRGETLTSGWAYLNEVRSHQKGDKTLWFASLGLQCGWQDSGGDKPEPVYQNIELLVGSSLVKTLSLLEGEYTKETGKPYGQVQIRNLIFSATEGTERIFLNTRGVLETITFGQLDE